ncbi:AAA family ATPase [Chitinophaga cymbidii]|uniref:J domain-containing protein n=1 Tax=Chitinophaga cymbidii TaxID=1096750 RepID=A0A512RNB1_9BACT|nr:AAA family ATPase [Chitinophaga cymbidii]GEP97182.1 hypothetical protein CCY01nite_34420 [Chitinophaga cymbidii]
MHIRSLRLENFKRFTDLTIQDIPEQAKLVLLIGSNGSGKSSVFDAFQVFGTQSGKSNKALNVDVFKDPAVKTFKITADTFEYGSISNENYTSYHTEGINYGSFYGRTSFRQIPRLTRLALGSQNVQIERDSDRAASFIDRDERFENDLEHLFGKLLKEFFRSNDDKSEIKERIINPINEALFRIFNKSSDTVISLLEIIPPLEGKVAEINFKKGNSVFHYNYLSAGEKEVFNILLNLIARREYYQNTIYYFDEIDLHLNTALQYSFLKEIAENWIPADCQLWTASHSLGFIEYANKSERAVIVDFDDLNFDLPQVLVPEPKESKDVYEIAVGKEFLPSIFGEMNIFFVENNDRDYYALAGIDNTIFVSDNSRNNVYHKVRTSEFMGIVDRDYLSDSDIKEIRNHYPRLHLLEYYSIENYLYHPDNLEEYFLDLKKDFNKEQYVRDLISAKNQCKDGIIPSLSLKRTEYPYFGEPEYNGKSLQNRFKNKQENFAESQVIAGYLASDNFDDFYKVLPMKTYCTQLPQRQNIIKSDLAKTGWFKKQIQRILGNLKH